MKFLSLFVASIYALGATAQTSLIGYPPGGANITPGKKLTVQVIRPDSLEGSTEVGIVIGLLSCANDPDGCPPPDAQIGTVLFDGTFNPTIHVGEEFGPYENFTVTVPSGFPAGTAQLATGRFYLIGAGPSPVLELHNVTLNVV